MIKENINKGIAHLNSLEKEAGGLSVKNLSVRLNNITVLKNISFQLRPKEHLAIIGSSGSGKTVLAKALSGKLSYQGSIEFMNKKLFIDFVEQHYHFKNRSNTSDFYYQQRYNSFDSEDAATVMDELQQMMPDASDAEGNLKIDILLQELRMEHRKNAPIIQLSSGEHKRFQLIKALLRAPHRLILDSPFVGLDSESRQKLNKIINETAASGTQIIIITNAHEIPACITHVALLKDGQLESFEETYCTNSNIKKFDTGSHYNFSLIPAANIKIDFSVAVKMVNTSIEYGNRIILNNINWEVRREERWLVKGENGAGKSTLLSLITGDNPKTFANEIYLFDKRRGSGESIWDIKQKIGYMSPELHWYFDTSTTVHQAIGSGFFDTIGLYKKLNANQNQRIEQWLNVFGLSHIHYKPLSAISMSEQRLTLLLRALVKDPPLLLLDEPCQGLDEEQTAKFVYLVDQLCEELDKTLIYISHYENEVPQCIKQVLDLNEGKANIYTLNTQSQWLLEKLSFKKSPVGN